MPPGLRAALGSMALLILAPDLVEAALAQVLEGEPNDTCLTAQDLGAPALPLTVDGSLESTFQDPDIDFFSVSLPPGVGVEVDLQGACTQAGTLEDPFLAVFDGSCTLIAEREDLGICLDSRVVVVVPDDGVLVLAATATADRHPPGGGQGSYRLTLREVGLVESISGRVVNVRNGRPLPGGRAPFSSAQLNRCTGLDCSEFLGVAFADADGRFRFDAALLGHPLPAGTYQVMASAFRFSSRATRPVAVAEGEDLDLGDIALRRVRFIDAILGRLVDAASGEPLPGDEPPFALVMVERCARHGCAALTFVSPVADGRFHVGGRAYRLPPGSYRVTAFANRYQFLITGPFEVGEDQALDLGDLPMVPARPD